MKSERVNNSVGKVPDKQKSIIEYSTPTAKYIARQSVGYDVILQHTKLIARNVLYVASSSGIHIRKLQHFRDLWRGKTKPSLLSVINVCYAIDYNINDLIRRDLVTEAIKSGTLHPKFNPETYRLPSDIW